jgi:DNA modification methylase
VLNIKERVVEGERSTYVMELIVEMRKQGWLWTEEYIWHKRNCYPGKWPNRFRDAWERCLHFTKQKKFAMYQDNVMVPMGDWADSRLSHLSETDKRRDNSRVESGFGKNISNWIGREMAYPTNVIHLATECANKGHSATFPVGLPSWFIRLLTKNGDLVLDPFMGSGTTAVACIELGRHYLGIETLQEYIDIAEKRVCEARRETRTSALKSGKTRSIDKSEIGGVLRTPAAETVRARSQGYSQEEESLFVPSDWNPERG